MKGLSSSSGKREDVLLFMKSFLLVRWVLEG